MDVSSAIHARRAVPSFDSSVEISLEELVALMNEANLAPSAMNLQPWEFLVCHTIEDKKRLQAVSYQQAKVAEASAVVVVLGNLQHHHHAPRIADENVKSGVLPEDRRDAWVAGAVGAYEGLAQKLRDEVLRGGSLWAMTFMYKALECGWDTAPMGGFEADKLVKEFGVTDTHVPVIMVAIGKRNPDVEIRPRSYRIPVSELIHLGNF